MYANWGLRLAAWFMDFLIIAVADVIIIFFFSSLDNIAVRFGASQHFREQMTLITTRLAWIIFILIPWLYSSITESSRHMATFGKVIFEIQVKDLKEEQISFIRATARFWAKMLSTAILFIGFIFPFFNPKHQALHDILAGTIVVNHGKNIDREGLD